MTVSEVIDSYNAAIYDTDRTKAIALVYRALDAGVTPEEVVVDLVTPALDRLVESVSATRDINLAQYFMASQIAAEITDQMVARFECAPVTVGHVVIGTSLGDLHSLGKRIVMGCLKSRMIGVTDLGVNVRPEYFVDEAVAKNAQVIAISSMMVHSARGEFGCLGVKKILKERGLDNKISVIVGGAPYRFDPGLWVAVQADAWAENAIAGGRRIAELVKEVQK